MVCWNAWLAAFSSKRIRSQIELVIVLVALPLVVPGAAVAVEFAQQMRIEESAELMILRAETV